MKKNKAKKVDKLDEKLKKIEKKEMKKLVKNEKYQDEKTGKKYLVVDKLDNKGDTIIITKEI